MLVEPPLLVLEPPVRWLDRSKLSWMPSARVSAVAWLRCMASRSLVASVSACRALSPMAVA